MGVYRHQWAGGKKSKVWYIRYKDHTGRVRRVPGYVDKQATEQKWARLVRKAERIREGLEAPDTSEKKSIFLLVDNWRKAMVAKGDGAGHAQQYARAVKLVIDGCGFMILRDMDGHLAQEFLESRLKTPERKGWTNRTYQWYRAALLAFGYWLSEKRKVLPSNPFTSIDERNPEIDPAIVRRALTDAEFRKMLKAARKGPVKYGLTGEQRYYLYVVAARTGLRLSACCALTPGHFDLSTSPSVASTNRMQKNKRAHTIPLAPDVAKILRKWFKGKPVDGLLWPVDRKQRAGGKMVRFDLEAAGIPFETKEGRVDFHALRHTFATALVRSGAGQVEVQMLLDHSSTTLSARYFRHLNTDELRKPVGRLPKL